MLSPEVIKTRHNLSSYSLIKMLVMNKHQNYSVIFAVKNKIECYEIPLSIIRYLEMIFRKSLWEEVEIIHHMNIITNTEL